MTKTIIPLPDGGYGLVDSLPKPERKEYGLTDIGEDIYWNDIFKWQEELTAQPYIPCLDSKEGEQHHQYWKDRVWNEITETVDYFPSTDYTSGILYALPAPVKEDLWEEAWDDFMKSDSYILGADLFTNAYNYYCYLQQHYIIQKKTN